MKYAPFESAIDLPFYYALASSKIDYDKLDDAPRRVLGQYTPNNPRVQIVGNALSADDVPQTTCRADGMIKNFNTWEEFKKADRSVALRKAASTIWDAIVDGTIYSAPSLLAGFLILSYADLKKYRFHHQFCFPALVSSPTWNLKGDAEKLDGYQTSGLVETVNSWRYRVDSRQRGFFLIKRVAGGWEIGELADFERGFFGQDVDEIDQYIAFVDPSEYADNPGWPLRNLLMLVRRRWGLRKCRVLCYRDTHSGRHEGNSLILNLELGSDAFEKTVGEINLLDEMPKATGWEKNDNGQVKPRVANLSAQMDPKKQADISVDLNLKLMKWRVATSLDLDIIKNTSCLLLGAGTLGAYVARILMGWGVKKISFVDSGTVSFSNPVRQPLFTFMDCIGGNTEKALRAAEAVKEIYPGVQAQGYNMTVPMAGHPFSELQEPEVNRAYEKLKSLIADHDVVFLLMDTRESRWLPTVMAKSMGKLVMNAALGFDSFVVMRHGVQVGDNTLGEELGCYYCNDIVAPADSLTDRTLDQQCTVTRPGVAPLASALLVELLISVLQHPLHAACPAPSPKDQIPSSDFEHPLGQVPHQMRGFLTNYSQMIVKGQAYENCSACSQNIIDEYRKGDWMFVKRALCEKGFVEEVSGLAEVQRAALAMEDDWSVSDDDGSM